ncbi:hypothetical protein F5Y06DRAFT_297151 [Hypoxylon sp. FL0890]|nr:hypothetical protein F5Y06DRAFT_297151 [Hypoxylon sp. FL0890]
MSSTQSSNQGEDVKVVHTDGTINYVDRDAGGGDAAKMPDGYFTSPQFIGTVLVATAWTLGSSISFLLFGRLSDIFGRKYLVVGTSVLGLVSYIIGAVTQNVPTLIAAKLIIGIAAAG